MGNPTLTLPPQQLCTSTTSWKAQNRGFYSTKQNRKMTATSTWEHAYAYLLELLAKITFKKTPPATLLWYSVCLLRPASSSQTLDSLETVSIVLHQIIATSDIPLCLKNRRNLRALRRLHLDISYALRHGTSQHTLLPLKGNVPRSQDFLWIYCLPTTSCRSQGWP